MALISPFRGLRYNQEKVRDLARVVTPPYDVIDGNAQNEYYERHPNNIIRMEYGKTFAADNETDNRYTRAAADFHAWLAEKVLVRENGPALYFYEQDYTVNSCRKTRSGLICLLKIEEYENNIVLPHEETMPKHKADRLALMNACGANFSPIFGIYADERHEINALLAKHLSSLFVSFGKPDVEFIDEQGQGHRLWTVTDRVTIDAVVSAMADKKVYIADGHHRYETALKYRDEQRLLAGSSGKPSDREGGPRNEPAKFRGVEGGLAPYEYVMVTLVNIFDPGLVILPTHRMIRNIPDFDKDDFLNSLATDFHVQELPLNHKEGLGGLWDAIGGKRHTFGVYCGNGRLYSISLKNSVDIDSVMPLEKSSAWRQLDVSILHTLVLDKHLGIGEGERAAGERLAYTRDDGEAIDAIDSGEFQLAFYINPTTVEEVTQVATKGEKMPQKSTFFYPKLITGLVLNKI